MRKRYIIGCVAALALNMCFMGCSHESDVSSPKEQAVESYNRIFIETFGEPAINHTWGFDEQETEVQTGTRGVDANGNHWALTWEVPDPLTESQLDKVRRYFQAIHEPEGVAIHYENFFVQQVYKGGTNPGSNSLEKYLAADQSTWINSGEHMDKLTCGWGYNTPGYEGAASPYFYDHIYNFNNADAGVYGNVMNNTSTDVNDASQQHPDKIMLMVNSNSDCFGYWNSNGSVGHNDRYVIIPGTVIDAWDGSGDAVSGRYFVAFDFDQLVDESIYAKGAFKSGTYEWDNSLFAYYKPEVYGETYHYLIADKNRYCGDLKSYNNEPNETEVQWLLDNGYLPVSGSADKQWVKAGSCADGYYSDWIVAITPGILKDKDTQPEDSGTSDTWGGWVRIIAEDLSVAQRTDFDFNDVVFDVRINTAKTKAQIKLKAAGGTLPLTVGWTGAVGTNYLEYEVHNLYKVGTNVMVNTHAKNGVDGKDDVIKTLTGSFKSANDVKIMVQKRGEWIEITAHTGEPASKIQVKTTYQWCDERQEIDKKYPKFSDYVTNPSSTSNWYE